MNKIYRLIGKKGRTTIPFEIRQKMRIGCNSLLSYEMKDENTIIIRREKVCDHCGDHGVKEGSILDVVNSLTETEQKALHRYLSIKLSSKERK
jgi:bifunctional DNA-binding transcriptional regulator/antitoxin component of YhaV-PrlF toxin-antitoxin module